MAAFLAAVSGVLPVQASTSAAGVKRKRSNDDGGSSNDGGSKHSRGNGGKGGGKGDGKGGGKNEKPANAEEGKAPEDAPTDGDK